jgi:hypothetical protein
MVGEANETEKVLEPYLTVVASGCIRSEEIKSEDIGVHARE